MPLQIAPGFHAAGDLFVVALFVGLAVLIAIVALSQQRTRAFSPSIVYLGLGVLAALGIALLDITWLDVEADVTVVEHVTELAVIVALFATGLKLDRPLRLRGWRSTALLLGVVMPLSIAAVALFGTLAMGLSAGAALVLGAALAPTDPVLAGDLGVGPPGDEDEAEPNFALTSEAGLNDGLAFPFVFLGLVIAAGPSSGDLLEWFAADVVYASAVGILAGALSGWALAAVAVRLRDRGFVAAALDGWAALGAVLVIYGLTQILDGYGFLAAFVGGIAFRRFERDHEYNQGVHAGAEVVEKVLELAVILLLGSLLTLQGLEAPGLAGWLLAPVLILAIRPVATMVGLAGAPMDRRARAYVGWFGVRGVGSIYYATAAVGAGILAPGEATTVLWTVIAVVMVSIVVHGATGTPLTTRLHGVAPDADEPPIGATPEKVEVGR